MVDNGDSEVRRGCVEIEVSSVDRKGAVERDDESTEILKFPQRRQIYIL